MSTTIASVPGAGALSTVGTLLNMACGRRGLDASHDRAQRLQIALGGLLASLVLSSLWGLAAGSSNALIALQNIYKLPVIVLLSALAAMPAGLLAWKLVGARYRASELLATYTSGLLSACLVMAVSAPVIGLYYHSSNHAGPVLALGSVFAAIGLGVLIAMKAIWRQARGVVIAEGDEAVKAQGTATPALSTKLQGLLPMAIIFLLQIATLVQLIALASPILPEVTVFDGGVDAILNSSAGHLPR